MDAVFHRLDDPVVNLDVFRGLSLDDGDSRAHDPGIADPGAGFDAECLGLVGGRDTARGFRQDRRHSDRPPAKRGVQMLFDGSEKGIAVDE